MLQFEEPCTYSRSAGVSSGPSRCDDFTAHKSNAPANSDHDVGFARRLASVRGSRARLAVSGPRGDPGNGRILSAENPLTESYSPVLHLALFSKWLADKQIDWPAQTIVTGFPWYDADGDAGLPEKLRALPG